MVETTNTTQSEEPSDRVSSGKRRNFWQSIIVGMCLSVLAAGTFLADKAAWTTVVVAVVIGAAGSVAWRRWAEALLSARDRFWTWSG